MPFQFIPSQRNGYIKLIDNGYLYVRNRHDKANIKKTMWKCDQHSRLRCRAWVHTLNGEIVKRTGEHCHAGEAGRIEALKVVNKVKELARSGEVCGREEILAQATMGISPAVADQMPSSEALRKIISKAKKYAQRNGEEKLPIPLTLEELNVSSSMQMTHAGTQFLLFDSGESPPDDRILVFSTGNNLHLLSQSPIWLASGSFKTLPPLFQQLYVIHAVVNNNNDIIPVVYAFLPRKDEQTFARFLDALTSLQPDLSPTIVINDFEIAYSNVFSLKFPDVQQKGSFYHFCQHVYRNIQATNGLQHRYGTDAEFSLKMRMLAALAFLPISLVANGFERLTDDDFPPEGRPVLDYVEDTFIGRLDHRLQRRTPPYDPSFWNCYDMSVECGFVKINSTFEKWHCSFGNSISSGKESIWKFINAVKNEQNTHEGKIEQLIITVSADGSTSKPGEPAKKKYRSSRDLASKIERIVKTYDHNDDVLNFLRGIATHFNY